MKILRTGLAVIAIGVMYMSSAQWTLALPRPDRPLTAEQQRLVREKKEYFARNGLPTESLAAADNAIDGPFPSRTYTQDVFATRQQVMADIQRTLANNEGVIRATELTDGPGAADLLRKTLVADQEAVLAQIPPEGRTFSVQMAEIGTHSIITSGFSHPTSAGGNPSDPVNVAWYGVGDANWVNYDMRNWTDQVWEGGAGGACVNETQWVLFDETQHGGTIHWEQNLHSLQKVEDQCASGYRTHVRIYDAATDDTIHYYRQWSVGTAHYEQYHSDVFPYPTPGHTIKGWEVAEETVHQSFIDSQGYLLWFVADMWYTNFWNSGTYQGYYNDGNAIMIKLSN